MTGVKVDVAALARLARLAVPTEELTQLEKEIPAILEFVEKINAAPKESVHGDEPLQNVMREDESPHESGIHTKELLNAAPAQKDDQVAVKQVISK